ncbi:MAG: DUF4398 domain-containing protein [Clostridia bacterium]|nr:DUF4398 domain-containing protein [Deltaproteobacteria bacterium]
MFVRGALAALICSALSSACSAVSAHHALADAQHALSQAEQHGAARLPMYEHAAAAAYLQKAREEGAHAEFEAARIYSKRAVAYAQKAEARAIALRDGVGYREPGPPTASPAMLPNDAEYAPLKRRIVGGK